MGQSPRWNVGHIQECGAPRHDGFGIHGRYHHANWTVRMAGQYERDCSNKSGSCSSEGGGGKNKNRDVQICALSAQNHTPLIHSLVQKQPYQNPFQLSYSKHSTFKIEGTA